MIFVYIFFGLIISLFIIAALMPKSYNIEKSAVISKPVREVMDRIGNLNEYSSWNPWQKMDPGAQKTITGTPHTPGINMPGKEKKLAPGA